AEEAARSGLPGTLRQEPVPWRTDPSSRRVRKRGRLPAEAGGRGGGSALGQKAKVAEDHRLFPPASSSGETPYLSAVRHGRRGGVADGGWRPVGAGLQTLPLIWYFAVGVPARRRMAPALGDPGRGRPAGGLPRLSARLRPAHARSPAADAGLSPRRPLRRGAPPLAGDARRAGRRPLLPRALRGARAHPAARSRGRDAGGRRAPGPRAGRSLLLPPGPHVSAL